MFRIFFTIFLFTSAMTFAQNSSSNDTSSVNHFIESFDAAWNMQNPQAFATLWVGDGDLITPWGRWIRGQGQIEKYFIQEKTGPFAKSILQQSTDAIRFLSSQLVFVDATMKFSGVVDPSENLPSNFVQHAVYILGKVDNAWKIISVRIYQFQPQHVD